jgi:rhomboid protease GluP
MHFAQIHEASVENTILTNEKDTRTVQIRTSYRVAMRSNTSLPKLTRFPWFTWIITIGTVAVWCFTAYQVAVASGAYSFRAILANVFANTQNADVLIRYGAKYNDAIIAGQYWRFITPIFLHANILHVSLNMLNFFILGLFIERLFGHLRFLLVYLLTGIVGIIASFYFAPQDVSVGASGAIFGIVGAYSIFILVHRRAFSRGGIPAIAWLVVIIGLNLGIGLVIPNVDNYAHLGGFLSGCLLGWFFAPFYVVLPEDGKFLPMDIHSLSRRWPLAVGSIAITILLAIIAVRLSGG